MYICLCKAITEEQLKKAAKRSGNHKETLKRLGLGDSCGVCLLDALNELDPTGERQSLSSQINIKPSK